MEMVTDFESILNDCLERILAKDETLEKCLARYPDYATELEPLLQVAITIKEALTISPEPEFREKARYEMRAAIQKMAERRWHGHSNR